MNTDRIKEIQQETAYPESVSVQQALLKVWNETAQEQLRIGAVSHSSFVGKTVYYSQKAYGEHKVVRWDENRAEFLLDLDGQRFWSNPFRIQNCC